MTSIAWVFKRHWHPERRWYARARALLLVLSGYETEICGRCGGKVGLVWHAPDEVWLKHSGYPTDGGVLCLHCFAWRASEAENGIYWECSSGGTWPSCSGQPCPHEELMMIVAVQRDRYYEDAQRYLANWEGMIERQGAAIVRRKREARAASNQDSERDS